MKRRVKRKKPEFRVEESTRTAYKSAVTVVDPDYPQFAVDGWTYPYTRVDAASIEREIFFLIDRAIAQCRPLRADERRYIRRIVALVADDNGPTPSIFLRVPPSFPSSRLGEAFLMLRRSIGPVYRDRPALAKKFYGTEEDAKRHLEFLTPAAMVEADRRARGKVNQPKEHQRYKGPNRTTVKTVVRLATALKRHNPDLSVSEVAEAVKRDYDFEREEPNASGRYCLPDLTIKEIERIVRAPQTHLKRAPRR
jgi:hypothetical protein